MSADPPTNTPTDAPPRELVIAWGVTLACLLAATWRLWTPWRDTPHVAPCQALAVDLPFVEVALLLFLALRVVRVVAAPAAARWSIGSATGVLAVLMAVDQLRWQPWAWHAVLAGVTLAATGPRRVVDCLRAVAVAVYAYSALAKLDAEFAATLGARMVRPLAEAIGAEPSRLAIGLPLAELALAGLLAASLRSRRLAWPACAAAVAMHAATIAVLSPWGLGHSLGVLVWNAGFAWQTVVLFRPAPRPERARPQPGDWLAYAACAVAVVAPLGTPLGWWDQWPGWALYAPGGERAAVYVDRSVVDRLPDSLKPHVDPAEPDSRWRRLRLDDWTLAQTGAPLYPQNRVLAAIAVGLIDRYALEGRVLVVAETAADRFTRERTQTELTDREEIEAASTLLGFQPGIVWTNRGWL